MRENDTKLILEKRFEKLSKHYEALKDYKFLIDKILLTKKPLNKNFLHSNIQKFFNFYIFTNL